MATFGTLTFEVLSRPHRVTLGAPPTVTHIPGSHISYIDLAGREPPRLALQVWLIDAALPALRALVGTSDLLAYVGGTAAAVLTSTNEGDRDYWSGDALHPAGWYITVDAEFLLL